MAHLPPTYITNRVLRFNVGFLLTSGPAHSHNFEIDLPTVRVADDLTVKYVRGPIRLSRTKEGILVQTHLQAALDDECYRCLDSIDHVVTLEIEELYTYQPRSKNTEFFIHDDGVLDLSPLLRDEVLIEGSHRALCQEDCHGLCPECGVNLNRAVCACDLDNIDPRLAKLRELLDT